MRTAVLLEPNQFELQDRPKPSPGPDDVLVAIRDVGICGSDVHYYEHGRIGDYVVEDPLVLGHESAGEVVDVGENVTGLEVGDPVTLEPGVPCRRCAHCNRGDYHLCEDVIFMATPPHDGAFTEYVLGRQTSLTNYPRTSRRPRAHSVNRSRLVSTLADAVTSGPATPSSSPVPVQSA